MASTQKKLSRVRPPRVQIEYEVETGGAIVMKQLPFVIGIAGDYSGNPAEPLPKFTERKFVAIDRDNFNEVLAGMKPRSVFRVANKLQNDGSEIGVELKFHKLDDFKPEEVVKQIEPLAELLRARQLLSELLTKMDGSNGKLPELLSRVIENTDELKKLANRPNGKNGVHPAAAQDETTASNETPKSE